MSGELHSVRAGALAPLRAPLASLLLAAPAWLPLLHPHFDLWAVFDGEVHLLRTFDLVEAIRAGNWFPRWFRHEYGGYGYPALNFYAPGLYYLTAFLAAVPGVGIYRAMQAVVLIGVLALLLGAWTLGAHAWERRTGATVGTLVIAYAPFVLPVNVYLTGQFAALLGIALTVWLLVGVHGVWHRAKESQSTRAWWWLTCLVTAGLLVTHNVSALFGVALASVWSASHFYLYRHLRPALQTATALAAGAALSSFFWLPAVLQTSLVQIDRLSRGDNHYRHHFIVWPGLHPPLWGEQTRSPWTVGFPFDLHLIYPNALYGTPRLGLWQAITVLAALASLGAWHLHRRSHKRRGDLGRGGKAEFTVAGVAIGLAVALGAYALAFDWSLQLWERFAAVRVLHSPARLLNLTVIGLGIASGAATALWVRDNRRGWAFCVLTAIILGTSGSANRTVRLDPTLSTSVGYERVLTRERLTPGWTSTSMGEFLPRSASYDDWHEGEFRPFELYERLFPEASWLAALVRPWRSDVAIHSVSAGPVWIAADVSTNGGQIAFHQLAFPGWRAWIDGQRASPVVVPRIEAQAFSPGFLIVDVPAGRHTVVIRFGPDLLHLGTGLLSAGVLATIGIWLLRTAPQLNTGVRHVARAASLLLTVSAVVITVRLLQPLFPPTAASISAGLVSQGLTDEVLEQRARITSPSGSSLGHDRFVDVRTMAVQATDRPLRDAGAESRRVLYAHPPAAISIDMTIPASAFLQTGLLIDPASWNADLGDGARFIITLTTDHGQQVTLLDAVVNPRSRGEQRRWIDQVIDLRPWAGQRASLRFETDPRESPWFDWAAWAEPALIRSDPVTAFRLQRSSQRIAAIALDPR